MRKHFLTTLIAGLAGVVFSATSCDPAESTPDPVFPDFVEKTVAAGETVELSFSANQDWTVSIPAAEAGQHAVFCRQGRSRRPYGKRSGYRRAGF